MHFGKRYEEISCLTDLEEMLVARVHPIISCWALLASGDYVYSGHCVNFRVNKQTWEDSLPRKIGECQSFLIRRKRLIPNERNSKRVHRRPFTANRNRVVEALKNLHMSIRNIKKMMMRANGYLLLRGIMALYYIYLKMKGKLQLSMRRK